MYLLLMKQGSFFKKNGRPAETLPPTSDALHYHILRSHYQALVWNLAHVLKPALPVPNGHGWAMESGKLKPELMSLAPVPDAYLDVISCGCS